MLHPNRRDVLFAAGLAAALGLDRRLAIVAPAAAQTTAPPASLFHRYKVGDITVTALYDGIWEKPHDAGFIKNASVEETKAALEKAGLPSAFVPVTLTVLVLNIGGRLVMVDAGSGVGQWQPTATSLPAAMKAAGIEPKEIKTILLSHFHPDHILGLMEKGTNAAVYPDAEIIVNAAEYKWWTEEGRVEKLPEGRRPLGARIQAVFPRWKTFKLVEPGSEVVPGVRMVGAPGHTPGHAAYVAASGGQQLMISSDTAYLPALLAPNPEWQGAYDQDGPMAVATRRKLLDQVIADKMMICGAHFPFPGAGSIAKDGSAYAFTPVRI
ncbi:MAG: MBL fold metallo-hydrolase [Hyphomicrobiaceae bacterium]|nr:MBL fold metallo-hydrolase [Hyphomicrobiaceae bacterium]